ncbi:hypothetical protein K435DRAFT_654046 [Dendrothele bispora CBS 962.96]|uniref:Cytochrome P450 n=1 Tax=Dendrothele bispora (strain CBS 962.96) TaxID=1314807 RepID=A0A4S8MHH1_DENBC|nr:hypothetical protein K435DRAFT_654046 [Dendrothele bispora CBS 962.96]
MDRPIALAVLVTLIICVFSVFSWRRRQKLAPGPPGYYLIIRNLFDMPAHDSQAWLTFADWAEQYGDRSSLTVLGQTFVLLNSVEVANEMLGAKSAIYYNRPRNISAFLISCCTLLSFA